MLLIGLTGSIAMGKSHVARLFRAMNVPVFDADDVVHRLLGREGAAVPAVIEAFSGVQAEDGSVDRPALGRAVFGDPIKLRRLEAIIHPLVRVCERGFLEQAARHGASEVVLDIPLLFETGGERRVDRVVVVGSSDALQQQRALRRGGMSIERLNRIRTQQMPPAAKRRLSDLFIPSGYDRGTVQRQLAIFLDGLATARARVWPHGYAAAARHGERIRHA